MSLDRSLKSSGSLSQHRNVLTRPERIAKLTEQGRFSTERPIHLVKVANRKVAAGKKSGKKGAAEEGAEGAAAAKK
ncbi:MAG: small basic protein [Planctomycetes bacterium]|nr:small basic protein [Planctomycetota bacterium]